jgi:hypothetical protein
VELFIDSGGDGLYTSGEQSGGFAEIQKEFRPEAPRSQKYLYRKNHFLKFLYKY